MSAESFSWVFERVLPRRQGVTDREKLLLLVLADSHSSYGPCHLKLDRLAAILGWGHEDTFAVLARVVKKGLLTLSGPEDGEYAFDFPEMGGQA